MNTPIYYIEYNKPKEYIWSRRRNLNGTKLMIGILENPPYLDMVSRENITSVGDEITYGKMVCCGINSISHVLRVV